MPLKVVYWNINKLDKSFCPELRKVAHDADILLLSESTIEDSHIEICTGHRRVPIKSTFDKLLTPRLYSKIPFKHIEHYSTVPSKRMIFYLLDTVRCGEIIIGGIHFPSKSSYNAPDQLSIAGIYSKEIREIEEQKGNKTILFGDFNMNPFEPGMIQPDGFNATLSYHIAKQINRQFHYNHYPYFYNPMWNWLGDRKHDSGLKKVPGSFYFKTTTDVTQIYCNVFDKVIIRPSIIDYLDYSSIKILETTPFYKLRSGHVDEMDKDSDHLPLTFNLNLNYKNS